jgi:hypothetical protein
MSSWQPRLDVDAQIAPPRRHRTRGEQRQPHAEPAIWCTPHADPSSTDVGDRLGGGGHRTVSQNARRVDRPEVAPDAGSNPRAVLLRYQNSASPDGTTRIRRTKAQRVQGLRHSRTRPADLRHLRGHRADPAAGHRPGDQRVADRVAASCGFAVLRGAGPVVESAPRPRHPPVRLMADHCFPDMNRPATAHDLCGPPSPDVAEWSRPRHHLSRAGSPRTRPFH